MLECRFLRFIDGEFLVDASGKREKRTSHHVKCAMKR